MINIGANGNKIAYGIKHFNIDEFEELEGINVYNLKPGSTAFIIHTSKVYMLDSDYKWIETTLGTGGGSGSNSGTGDSGNGGNDSDNDGDLDNGETGTPEYDGGSIDGTDPDDTTGNWDGGSIDGTDPEIYDGGSIDDTDPA